jgi:hypothetical protein
VLTPGYTVVQNGQNKFLTPPPGKLPSANSDSDLIKPPPPKPSRTQVHFPLSDDNTVTQLAEYFADD